MLTDFLQDGKWVCRKCAACCFAVGTLFKEWDRGDGGCVHLTDDLLCSIYETRPDVCRVSEMDRRAPTTPEQKASLCEWLRANHSRLEAVRHVLQGAA